MKRFALSMWFGVALSILISVICSFLLVKSGMDFYANAYNECSIYDNSGCDFLIPGPADGQISELEAYAFIDTVTPFYFTQTKTSVNGKEGTDNVIMVDSIESMSATVYNDARLIKGEGVTAHSAVADFAYANKYNISVGDTVTVTFASTSYQYRVSSIYEKNTLYQDGVLLINWSDSEKQAVAVNASSALKYSGAWVKSQDNGACASYLTNEYKPLGRLKDRSEFDSDEAYQIHVDAFNSASFASEITDFSQSLKQLENKNSGFKVKANVAFAFAVVLPVGVCLVKTVLLGYGKRWRELARKAISARSSNRATILRYKNTEVVASGVAILVSYAIFIVLYKLLASVYIKLALLSTAFAVCAVAIVVCTVVVVVANSARFNKAFKTLAPIEKKKELEEFAESKLAELTPERRMALKDAVSKAVKDGKDAIDSAETSKDIRSAFKEAKNKIERIEKKKELEEFAESKLAELTPERRMALKDAVSKAVKDGKDAIDSAETSKDIRSAFKEAKNKIERILKV